MGKASMHFNSGTLVVCVLCNVIYYYMYYMCRSLSCGSLAYHTCCLDLGLVNLSQGTLVIQNKCDQGILLLRFNVGHYWAYWSCYSLTYNTGPYRQIPHCNQFVNFKCYVLQCSSSKSMKCFDEPCKKIFRMKHKIAAEIITCMPLG